MIADCQYIFRKPAGGAGGESRPAMRDLANCRAAWLPATASHGSTTVQWTADLAVVLEVRPSSSFDGLSARERLGWSCRLVPLSASWVNAPPGKAASLADLRRLRARAERGATGPLAGGKSSRAGDRRKPSPRQHAERRRQQWHGRSVAIVLRHAEGPRTGQDACARPDRVDEDQVALRDRQQVPSSVFAIRNSSQLFRDKPSQNETIRAVSDCHVLTRNDSFTPVHRLVSGAGSLPISCFLKIPAEPVKEPSSCGRSLTGHYRPSARLPHGKRQSDRSVLPTSRRGSRCSTTDSPLDVSG